jgi:hypothetical protein
LKCRGHTRAGKECRRDAMLGGFVCRVHGGAAPQVKNKARDRLAALVHPAIGRLAKLIDADSHAVALGAVRDVLDRAGYKPKEHIVTEGSGESTEAKLLSDIFTPEELNRIYARVTANVGGDGKVGDADPSKEQAIPLVS